MFFERAPHIGQIWPYDEGKEKIQELRWCKDKRGCRNASDQNHIALEKASHDT